MIHCTEKICILSGKEFTSPVVSDLYKKFKVEQRFGREYAPTSQGCVERTNQTLKKSIFADLQISNTWTYVRNSFVISA